MLYFIKEILNNIFFPLRCKIGISRPIKTITNEDKTGIFTSDKEIEEEEKILRSYNFYNFREKSRKITYKENLYCLKLLEDHLESIDFKWEKENLKVLDIGSRNFSYAPALHNFFSYYKWQDATTRGVMLDGIEIDPYRLMVDLHSRLDYAHYYIKTLVNTRYITGDLLNHKEEDYDIILLILPFIHKKPLLNWGLPSKHLRPKQILKHAYQILNTGGIIILVNQLKIEKDAQQKIIEDLGLNYKEFKDPYTNLFSPFSCERYITIINK